MLFGLPFYNCKQFCFILNSPKQLEIDALFDQHSYVKILLNLLSLKFALWHWNDENNILLCIGCVDLLWNHLISCQTKYMYMRTGYYNNYNYCKILPSSHACIHAMYGAYEFAIFCFECLCQSISFVLVGTGRSRKPSLQGYQINIELFSFKPKGLSDGFYHVRLYFITS